MKKILYILVIFILIFNLSLIVQEGLFPEKLPSFFGIKLFVMDSDNMKPKLKNGDILLIRKVNLKKLKEKDIIIYKQGFDYSINRITKKIDINDEVQFKTKSDNNNAENSGTIKTNLIEGKVIGKIPYVGRIFSKEIITIFILIIGCFFYFKR